MNTPLKKATAGLEQIDRLRITGTHEEALIIETQVLLEKLDRIRA